jgi:hypothetical protein
LSGQDSNCLGGRKARSEEKAKLVPGGRIAPRVHITLVFRWPPEIILWFAKTLADFEINDIATLPPPFCYNSYLCFDSSACASERWFASCARVGASYSRISRYVNNSPS